MRTLNVIALMLALVYGCFAVDLTLGIKTSVSLNATAGTGSVVFLLSNTSSVAGTDSVSYNINSTGAVNVTAGSHSFVNVNSATFVVDHCAWQTLDVNITTADVAEVNITAATQPINEVTGSQFGTVAKNNTNLYNLISFNVTEVPLNVTLSTNGTVTAYFQQTTYPGATCSFSNCTATNGNCTVLVATNGTWHILVSTADATAEWSVVLGENTAPTTTTTTTTTGNATTTTTSTGGLTTGNVTTTTTGGNTTTTTTGGNSTTTTTGGLTTGNANTTTTTTTTTGALTSSTTTTTSSSSESTTTTTTGSSSGGSGDGWKVAVGILVPVGVIAVAGGVGLWWYKRKNSRGFHTV